MNIRPKNDAHAQTAKKKKKKKIHLYKSYVKTYRSKYDNGQVAKRRLQKKASSVYQ